MGQCLCLCVSVSVTSRCSTKTAKRRITQTTPHDSPGILVFYAKDLREILPGQPVLGRQMQVGWVKIGDFRHITGYISKTVKDRHIVSIKVEYEVVYALSNNDIAHDLECPLTTPSHPIFCILHRHSVIHSFVTGEPTNFKFGILI